MLKRNLVFLEFNFVRFFAILSGNLIQKRLIDIKLRNFNVFVDEYISF
ncbi:hypothetical protein SAMN05444397_106310 [Flavobacterium aquidurense]|nr:hypothetical protein SAMN05444397_106310 [Flavobacterium aquidurense]